MCPQGTLGCSALFQIVAIACGVAGSKMKMKKVMKMKLLKIVTLLNLAGFVGAANAMAAENTAASDATKPVYEHYLKIQTALADDSMNSVSENAATIAKAVRQQADQHWPDQLAAQSDALAKATNLDSAREAFKSVSKSLIEHWAAHETLAGQYQRAYCPDGQSCLVADRIGDSQSLLWQSHVELRNVSATGANESSTSAGLSGKPKHELPGGKNMNCTGIPAGCCAN